MTAVWSRSTANTGSAMRCPDDGVCFHGCDPGLLDNCWRFRTCEPLSGVFPNDEWPEMSMEFSELLNKCRVEGHQWAFVNSDRYTCAHCGTIREGDKYIFPANILSVLLPDDLPTLEEALALRDEVRKTLRKKDR